MKESHHHFHQDTYPLKSSGVGGSDWPGWARFILLVLDRLENVIFAVDWFNVKVTIFVWLSMIIFAGIFWMLFVILYSWNY